VTTLENRLMPLVRWEIGDYALARDGPCACGRTLPLIGRIIGRAINLFRRPEGTLYSPWALHEVLRDLPEIREIQIVQRGLTHYVVRVASGVALGAEHAALVQAGFSALLGAEVKVEVEQVERIERTPYGKYMAALSEVG
jgi:phenylacetate-CoA ligase